MHVRIKQLEAALQPLRFQLQNHTLYTRLLGVQDIQLFMENHVFAVWDFMSLLKVLQNDITCNSLPWIPGKNATLARFINEIVHAEESDVNEMNVPKSHFEMYIDAMHQVGANAQIIHAFITEIQQGSTVADALENAPIPAAVKAFVNYSFQVIATKETHKIAAAFTFGREDVIPDMFLEIVKKSENDSEATSYSKLTYYLQRHIELDGDEHGPLSLQMVATLCGDDPVKWAGVTTVAKEALQHRIFLWDAISETIKQAQEAPVLV